MVAVCPEVSIGMHPINVGSGLAWVVALLEPSDRSDCAARAELPSPWRGVPPSAPSCMPRERQLMCNDLYACWVVWWMAVLAAHEQRAYDTRPWTVGEMFRARAFGGG